MVLKWKLGHLVRTDFLPLKRNSFYSTQPSFDSTVIILSRDIVHTFEKLTFAGKKLTVSTFTTNTHHSTFYELPLSATFVFEFSYERSHWSIYYCVIFPVPVNQQLSMLTTEQGMAFCPVSAGHNLLITGQAGTGKTYLIKQIVNTYRLLKMFRFCAQQEWVVFNMSVPQRSTGNFCEWGAFNKYLGNGIICILAQGQVHRVPRPLINHQCIRIIRRTPPPRQKKT